MAKIKVNSASIPWGRVGGLALVVALIGIVTNELTLRLMGHRPSIVSDERLWSMTYDRFDADLDERAIVLLGASRMQGDISLAEVKAIAEAPSVYQLALSGRGSAFAVFEKIVAETDFKGLIVISETEQTLVGDPGKQFQVVQAHEHRPLDANFNRKISNFLESNFVFLNPNSSSYRLWGNLLFQQEAPEVFHVATLANREQSLDFTLTDKDRINRLRGEVFRERSAAAESLDPQKWKEMVVSRWQEPIAEFQERGGRIVFVRFPVSAERSLLELERWPIAEYWQSVMKRMGVPALHYRDQSDLGSFEFPDSSHLDMRDKVEFTRRLFGNPLIKKQLEPRLNE